MNAALLPYINAALAHLSEPALGSVDEEGARAAAVRVQMTLDPVGALQRRFEFGFTKARAVLSMEPEPALGPLKNRFRVPEDCVQVRSVDGLAAEEWEMAAATVGPIDAGDDTPAARVLVCNLTAPEIIYSRRVDNPSAWDALFGPAFSLALAVMLAPAFGKGRDFIDSMEGQLVRMLLPVRQRSAQERAARRPPPDVPFISARRR